eukprot:c16269_g1_i1.p1 GENE.c16269_g1_i1~~c16269_g1_i1.p1  ORF type:complete len:199 (+),score=8.83 c16269_g1_i1:49-597(+)
MDQIKAFVPAVMVTLGFVLFLAALANDVWSEYSTNAGDLEYGIFEARGNGFSIDYKDNICKNSFGDKACSDLAGGGAMCFIFTFVALIASFIAFVMVAMEKLAKPITAPHPILSLNNMVLCSLITGVVGWLLWLIIAQSRIDRDLNGDPSSSFGCSVAATFFMAIAYFFLKGFGLATGAAAA